jgi:hypothetical protein
MRGHWARDDPAFLLILLTIMAGKRLIRIRTLLYYLLHISLIVFSRVFYSISNRLWSMAEATCVGVLPSFAVDRAQ